MVLFAGLADFFNLLSGANLESHLSCGTLLWFTKGPPSETKTQVNDFFDQRRLKVFEMGKLEAISE